MKQNQVPDPERKYLKTQLKKANKALSYAKIGKQIECNPTYIYRFIREGGKISRKVANRLYEKGIIPAYKKRDNPSI